MLNSDIIFPVASEKSGKARSGIDGSDTDGNAGIVGIMSRADLVMLSIRLGAASSARARAVVASNMTSIESVLIRSPIGWTAASADRGVITRGHQMHELGSIDVMSLDQTLSQSRHVACASGGISMRTSLEPGVTLHSSAVMFP